MNASDLVERFEGVRETGRGRWSARCPAHGDQRASLSVRELDDGRTLLHCFAGCHVDDVVGAVGMSVGDLFPQRPTHPQGRVPRSGLHPLDALHCLAHEARVVLIAGRTLELGQALSDGDMERLGQATYRIGAALEVCHV